MTMTETTKTKMTVQEQLDALEAKQNLHKELISGALEVLLGACEAGQELEDHAKETAILALDNADRIDKVGAAAQLMNDALRALITSQKGIAERLTDLEKQNKELTEMNSRLVVANIEIRQVLYGQITLEEWDQKSIQRDEQSKNRDKRKKSFEEGSLEG